MVYVVIMTNYRPQTKFAKVMFLHVSVSHSVHGGGGIPACLAGGIPACLAGLQRGVSQHALQVFRPTPKGKVEGSGWEGSPDPHLGESPGLHPRGVSRSTPRGCIPACTEADTPHLTATAAGGTHPTGMHSCCKLY